MRSRKNLIPLILAIMMLSLPITTSAQVFGIDVYASRTSLGMLVMDESFNATTEVYHLVFGQAPSDSPSYRPWNIGLGLVEVVFSLGKYPKNLYAYIEVGGEPLIDMLINFTIADKTHEYPNGTQVSAKYVAAYIYLFANHSITNETAITHYLAPAISDYDSGSALASDTVVASEVERVTVAYSMQDPIISDGILILVLGVTSGFVIMVIVVWFKRSR